MFVNIYDCKDTPTKCLIEQRRPFITFITVLSGLTIKQLTKIRAS